MKSSLALIVIAGLLVALIVLSSGAAYTAPPDNSRVFARSDHDRQTLFFGFGRPFYRPWGWGYYDYGYPYYNYPAAAWIPPQPVYFTDKIMASWVSEKKLKVLWIGDTKAASGISVTALDGSRKLLSVKPRDMKLETYAVTLKIPKHTVFIGVRVLDPRGGVVADLVEPLPMR